MIIYLDDELVVALSEHLKEIWTKLDIEDIADLKILIDLHFSFMIKEEEIIRLNTVSSLSEIVATKKANFIATPLANYKNLQLSDSFIKLIENLYFINCENDFHLYLFTGKQFSFEHNKAKSNISNGNDMRLDNDRDIAKEFFIDFPYLPGKFSCALLIAELYLNTNQINQTSYLFFMLFKLIKDEQLLLKKAGLRNLEKILKKFRYAVSYGKLEGSLNTHKLLIENCMEVFTEVNFCPV